jgi:hypothetical protein
MSRRAQLVITYFDHQVMYFPVSYDDGGWKVDAASRCIVIGRGVPRTWIPLDQVRHWDIEGMSDGGDRDA